MVDMMAVKMVVQKVESLADMMAESLAVLMAEL